MTNELLFYMKQLKTMKEAEELYHKKARYYHAKVWEQIEREEQKPEYDPNERFGFIQN